MKLKLIQLVVLAGMGYLEKKEETYLRRTGKSINFYDTNGLVATIYISWMDGTVNDTVIKLRREFKLFNPPLEVEKFNCRDYNL